MNKGFIKFGLLMGVVLAFVVGFIFAGRSVVQATQNYEDDGCTHTCPTVEWTHYYCPEGYDLHEGVCRDWGWTGNGFGWKYANKIQGDTFNVTYEKSNDPNKCHRPSDNDLKDKYGMSNSERSAFKSANPEHLNSIESTPEGYYSEEGACYPKVPVCADDSALNYGGEDGKFDDVKEVANNELCTYPEEPKTPVCLDEEAINYDSDFDEETEIEDKNVCRYKEPEEPQEPEQPQGHIDPAPAGAPTCDGVPFVKLPANVHVVRNGDTAEVKWVPTQGGEVSIFYYENENPSNAHGVAKIQNDGSEVIGSLGNANWTFGVLQWDGCAASGTVWVVDDNIPTLFRLPAYDVVSGVWL